MAKRSGYEVYLKNTLLPVTPEKMSVKIKGNNKTVNLINEGEVNILKMPGLTEIELECEIPQVRQPYAIYKSGFRDAQYYLDILEDFKTKRRPFQFIVSRRTPGGDNLATTNIKVALEDYDIVEDAGNGFDFRIKIKLKQYRNYGTKEVNITLAERPQATVEQPRETDNSPAPTVSLTYTVKKNDCLYNIAKYYYGNGNLYPKIYDANRGVIGGNPNLIYPGQVLTIPPA